MKLLTSTIYVCGCLVLLSGFSDPSTDELKINFTYEATVPRAQKEELELIFLQEEQKRK